MQIPLCIRPAPLPRARSGHSSATSDAPVTHSDPIAIPTRNRSTANDSQLKAKAVSPVITE